MLILIYDRKKEQRWKEELKDLHNSLISNIHIFITYHCINKNYMFHCTNNTQNIVPTEWIYMIIDENLYVLDLKMIIVRGTSTKKIAMGHAIQAPSAPRKMDKMRERVHRFAELYFIWRILQVCYILYIFFLFMLFWHKGFGVCCVCK